MIAPSSLRRRAGRATFGALSLFVLLALTLPVGGCGKSAGRELQPGIYRATIDVGEGRRLPFGLDVAQEESGFVLYLVNGEERVRVTEVEAREGRVAARFPGYENGFTATIDDDELEGTLTIVHDDGRRREWPFEARLGETWRFFAELPTDNADLSGRWDVTYTDAAGRRSSAVADFQQRFAQVTGTVIGPTEDQRFLAGEVRDEELRLSRFDGGEALLYSAKLDDQGRLVGEFWSDRGGRQRFVAVRNPDATPDAAVPVTRLRNPGVLHELLALEFEQTLGRLLAETPAVSRGSS